MEKIASSNREYKGGESGNGDKKMLREIERKMERKDREKSRRNIVIEDLR